MRTFSAKLIHFQDPSPEAYIYNQPLESFIADAASSRFSTQENTPPVTN